MPLYVAVASTSTGQPGLMSPVSTFRERMRCFLVVPPSGVIIALKKSARDARSTIGRPHDTHGIKITADEVVCRHRIAHVALPDDRAVHSVERVDVIRFGYCNNHRFAARAIIKVKRLRVDISDNCAIKVQVARQIGGCALGECGINVQTVT